MKEETFRQFFYAFIQTGLAVAFYILGFCIIATICLHSTSSVVTFPSTPHQINMATLYTVCFWGSRTFHLYYRTCP